MRSETTADIWNDGQISLLGDDMGCDNWDTNIGRKDSTLWSGHIQVGKSSRLLTAGYQAELHSSDTHQNLQGKV